ncbi:MAG: hypothetical protein JXC36_03270 [Candidatus Atribacteria bacterium]|nr:hypothetical protein [Candidatus Atribacteria bacterium]
MTIIKSAWEIAMEKAKNIEKLSAEELEEIKQQEIIDSILAQFYKDQIGPDDLWRLIKDLSENTLIKAQHSLLQSLTFFSNDHDFKKRKNGILAIENLKNIKQSSLVEQYFDHFKKIKKSLQNDKKEFLDNVEKDLEFDPQKKMQVLRQGNQIMLKELSLEEVIDQNQQLKQEMQKIEKHWKNQFDDVKQKLLNIVNTVDQ